MTKEFQKELLEKVKPGTKPSQLKKSKSADQFLQPKSTPLTKSKSAETFADSKYPYTTLISQAEELEKLRKESETKSTTITLLRKKNAELEKALNQANSSRELSSQLDQALIARHQNLKDWFSQYQRANKLDKELTENIEEVSTELNVQDQLLTKLRSENNKLKRTNSQLTQDLSLSQRLVELRQDRPFGTDNFNSLNYFKYAVYALLAVWFCLMLRRDYAKK